MKPTSANVGTGRQTHPKVGMRDAWRPFGFAWPLVPAFALIALALTAYLPALHGGFIWDDDSYVTRNPTLKSFEGLARIWLEPTASPQYYPLVFTTFWIEYRVWDLAPFGYHLTNVLLHGLNGILLWRALSLLQVPAAWLIAAVFVVHPVHVESVAWITERKNVLSASFYLAAALAYFRFMPPDPAQETPRRWGWYAASLGLYLAALLSKTVTCSLPAAVLLVLWWKRPRLTWRDVLPLAPFFALGVSLALVTVWLEKHHVGASGYDWNLTLVERCLIAGRALCFYASTLVYPVDLTFIYPRWDIDASASWQYLFPLAVLAVLATCWFGRGLWGKGPLVACLFFAGTLFPALGFVDVYPMRFSFVADHFQYLASAGMLALVLAAGQSILRRLAGSADLVEPLAGAACVLFLAVLTWGQGYVYADLDSLWTDTVTKNPGAFIAHNELGELLFERGKIDEAQRHYEEAVRIKPLDAIHHYNLGKSFWAQGRVEPAIRAFEKAVELKADYVEAQFNLGLALRRQGRTADAIVHFQRAIEFRPSFAPAHLNLGTSLAQQGKPGDAIPHFLEAARFDRTDPGPSINLALAHAQLGQSKEALRYAQDAATRWPTDTRVRQLLDGLLRADKETPR